MARVALPPGPFGANPQHDHSQSSGRFRFVAGPHGPGKGAGRADAGARVLQQPAVHHAIRMAREARTIPATAPAATVVFARALLERFRQTSEAPDLDLARNALKGIDPTRSAAAIVWNSSSRSGRRCISTSRTSS